MIQIYLLVILVIILYYLINKENKENVENVEKFENNKNVIMTTYFCKKKDPQRKNYAPCDDFIYIKPWYNSIKRLGLRGIIFHDGMSKKFIKQYETENIRFEYVDSKKFEYSLNDQRFLIYYDYLLKHSEISNVFMTDGNDVKLVKSPFNNICNNLCVGSEKGKIKTNKWLQTKINILNSNNNLNCEWKNKNVNIYNAGILGGNRKIVMEFLKEMRNIFIILDKKQKKENLNMSIFNYVMFNNFSNKNILTGEKLHSVFKEYQNNRKDVYFIHK
jgi:hypothetical protein